MGSKIYQAAQPAVMNLIDHLLNTRYHEFAENNVKVAATMVSKFNQDEMPVPCLKLHGASCYAIIRLVRIQQKVYLAHDAEILIDAFHWDEANPTWQQAVLNHELTHLELCKTKQGKVKLDDNGRPRLRLKPDDYSLTGFYSNISTYGAYAPEWTALNNAHAEAETAMASWVATPDGAAFVSSHPDSELLRYVQHLTVSTDNQAETPELTYLQPMPAGQEEPANA